MNTPVLAAGLLLAFANGANDMTKGVATLVGTGLLSDRKALALATGVTILGGVISIVLAQGLLNAFSAKGLIPDELLAPQVLGAVALGAAGTVLAATGMGLPISTTHALLGSLAGAGLMAAGERLDVERLLGGFLLPLALSPLLAVVLGSVAFRALKRRSLDGSACVCVTLTSEVGLAANGRATLARGFAAVPSLLIGSEESCPHTATRIRVGPVADALHVSSGALVAFARGLNDVPKIAGILVGAAVLEAHAATAAVVGAMCLGGLWGARHVTRTLAHEIAPLAHPAGLAANLATSVLVLGASRLGVPVSTTHVSAGGIIGVGATGGGLDRRTTARLAAAWLGTLPVAAGLTAIALTVLR